MATLPIPSELSPCQSVGFVNLFAVEAKYEFLKLLRRRAFFVATLGFPVMLYLLFGIASQPPARQGFQVARYLLGGYAAFGVVGAALFGIGLSLSMERAQGWLELKRASPMSLSAYMLAKCTIAGAFGLLTVSILTAIAITLGGVTLSLPEFARLLAFSFAGAIPFGALGVLLAFIVPPNAAHSAINLIYIPTTFLSGLWMPLSSLPHWLQRVAHTLPSYHFAQILLGVLGYARSGSTLVHWSDLGAFTLIMLILSWLAFQRGERSR